jgi:trehalose 6-phosphate synthase
MIVATNRGPVEFYRSTDGRLHTRRGPGGLVTAFSSLSEHLPLTWIATTMTDGDREAFAEAEAPAHTISLGGRSLRVRYVPVARDMYHRYYEQISNGMLWLLQHYLFDLARSPDFTEAHYHHWEQGYVPVNDLIARAVAEEARSTSATHDGRHSSADGRGAIVFLQDYHLYLAARAVRERVPRATVQQFIHIPWPAVRYWEFLPEPFLRAIYGSLVANDVLGLQTQSDVANFLSCAEAFLKGSRVDRRRGLVTWQGDQLAVRAYPIPVDVAEARQALQSAAGRRGERELRERGLLDDGRQVIVRVDRLDLSKNIVRGFAAYALLLRRHDELRGRVRMLAFLVPSREGLAQYRAYARRVRSVIQRINQEFGTPDWQPITPFLENNRPRALAAMKHYDVLLVNPVMDGMNLVAKEGPAVNARDGVVLLSRTAGAYAQLGEAALAVTATDLYETEQQLYNALVMPRDERARRAASARAVVEAETPRDWMLAQLRDAEALCRPASSRTSPRHVALGDRLAPIG